VAGGHVPCGHRETAGADDAIGSVCVCDGDVQARASCGAELPARGLRAGAADEGDSLITPHWWLTRDGDKDCLELSERHYPRLKRGGQRRIAQFVGPGEKLVLRTEAGDCFFVWRRFVDDCRDERTGERQQGVNCAAFRNEGPIRSSDLIRQADAIADVCWPDRRHYTYVNPQRIQSEIPGYCFRRAGWKRCGVTKGGLVVLERIMGEQMKETA
jgi:hypothetical protein